MLGHPLHSIRLLQNVVVSTASTVATMAKHGFRGMTPTFCSVLRSQYAFVIITVTAGVELYNSLQYHRGPQTPFRRRVWQLPQSDHGAHVQFLQFSLKL